MLLKPSAWPVAPPVGNVLATEMEVAPAAAVSIGEYAKKAHSLSLAPADALTANTSLPAALAGRKTETVPLPRLVTCAPVFKATQLLPQPAALGVAPEAVGHGL
mmetsp:Transcript_93385/g.264093  ORF Transcript_93385/g.264093 Transcript_93385/m.264093 type:complete len:104 (-) Transcript_93385:2015-2326(-)